MTGGVLELLAQRKIGVMWAGKPPHSPVCDMRCHHYDPNCGGSLADCRIAGVTEPGEACWPAIHALVEACGINPQSKEREGDDDV